MDPKSLRPADAFYFHRASGTNPNQSARHAHETTEIYFMLEGACRYDIAGRIFEVTEGDVLLIPVGTPHRTDRYSRHYTRLLINFPKEYLAPAIEAALPVGSYLYRDPDLASEASRLFTRIEREYKSDDPLREAALRCYTEELVLLLARSKNTYRNEHGKEPVEQTLAYISENYMTEITLPRLAAMHGITPGHLSRTFKKETGYGISEYLTLVRLRKAEFMLKNEPGRTISEIAYACGWSDSNYFSDRFKRAYGFPPSHLRKGMKSRSARKRKENGTE